MYYVINTSAWPDREPTRVFRTADAAQHYIDRRCRYVEMVHGERAAARFAGNMEVLSTDWQYARYWFVNGGYVLLCFGLFFACLFYWYLIG